MVAFPALIAAGGVLVGAVVAVSSRDPRTATVGLLAVLLGVAFVADPLPPPPALAVRLVAGILAGYLLWVVVCDAARPTMGSALGWPAESTFALTGAVIGWASHGLGAPGRGPEAASAVGVGLLVLAAAPIVLGSRDAFRVGIGLSLLLAGTFALRVGLVGTPDPAEQIVLGGLTAGLGAVVARIVRDAVAVGGAAARDDGAGQAGDLRAGQAGDR